MNITFARKLLATTLITMCAMPVTMGAHASANTGGALRDANTCRNIGNGNLCFAGRVGTHPLACYRKDAGTPVRVRLGFQVRSSGSWITRWDWGYFIAHARKYPYCFSFPGQTVTKGHQYRGVLKQDTGRVWFTGTVQP